MNAWLEPTTATKMPSVIILKDHSSALAQMDLLAMVRHAQILMSVRKVILVMIMRSAPICLEHMFVCAMRVLPVMV